MGLTFTDRELEMMNILWDEGSATVREARDVVGEDTPYTSVLSIFQILEDKGHVRHEREGRAYRYYPVVEREEAAREAVEYVLGRFFEGSPRALAATLASLDDLTPQELEAAARTLTAGT